MSEWLDGDAHATQAVQGLRPPVGVAMADARAPDSAGSDRGRGLVEAEPEVQILRVARHDSQRTAGLLEQREPLCRRLKTVRRSACSLGGLVNIDMNTGYLWHEVPVTARSRSDRNVTFNATHLEISGDRLRVYTLPDDSDRPGQSCLPVLEAET